MVGAARRGTGTAGRALIFAALLWPALALLPVPSAEAAVITPPPVEALWYAAPSTSSLAANLYVDPTGPCPTCRPDVFAGSQFDVFEDVFRVRPSPDGRWVAMGTDTTNVRVVAYNGTEHPNTAWANANRGFAWLRDSSGVVFDDVFFGLQGINIEPGGFFSYSGSVGFGDPFVLPNNEIIASSPTETRRFFDTPNGTASALVRPFPIPADLIAMDGLTFARADPEGRLIIEDLADPNSARILDQTPGRTPFAYNGEWVAFHYQHITEGDRWGLARASDGFPMEAAGFPGMPVPGTATFSFDGSRLALLVDHGLNSTSDSLAVRELRGPWTGFSVPYPDSPFGDLAFGPPAPPPRTYPGDPLTPSFLPPTSDSGRILFESFNTDRPQGLYTSRVDGTDVQPFLTDPEVVADGFNVLGPGPGPGTVLLETNTLGIFLAGPPETFTPFPLPIDPFDIDHLHLSPAGNRMAIDVDGYIGPDMPFFGVLVFQRNGTAWEEIARHEDADDSRFVTNDILLFNLGSGVFLRDLRQDFAAPVAYGSGLEGVSGATPSLITRRGLNIERVFYAANGGNLLGSRRVIGEEMIPLDVRDPFVLALGVGENNSGDLHLVDFDGVVTVLVEGPASFLDTVFAPDGRGVIVHYSRSTFAPLSVNLAEEDPFGVLYVPLSGGPAISWPASSLGGFSFLPIVTSEPTDPAPTSDATAAALVGSGTLPTYTAGTGTAPTESLSGTVVYKSRFGKGATITIRDGSGGAIPVQRVGDSVVWDTTSTENGYYTVEETDSGGGILESASYLVQNPRSTPRRVGIAAAAGVAVTTGFAWAGGLLAATKESAIEAAESRMVEKASARGATRNLVGIVLRGAALTVGGVLLAGALLGIAGTYEKAAGFGFSLSRYLALLPFIGGALLALFALEVLIDRVYARHLGHETHFQLWVPGAASLALSTLVFATPFGVPGHVKGAQIGDRRLEARRGLATFAAILTLLLPFVAISRFNFPVYEIGVSTALMLAVNVSIPVADLPGAHVWRWNKLVWGALVLAAFLLFFASLIGLATPIVFAVAGGVGLVGLAWLFAVRRPGAGV